MLAFGRDVSSPFDTSDTLRRAITKFDIFIAAEMTSADVEARATAKFDAAAVRGEFAGAVGIDGAGSIAQNGVIYLLDAFDSKMPRTKPPWH
jgi:hypothetical protein